MAVRPLEIVVVDDEIQITELLKTFILSSEPNTNIHTFNDALQAREYIRNNTVDILITDYKMPKVNGIELIKISDPGVKKILISGYVSEIAEERLQELNAVCFEKPVPMKSIGKIIMEAGKHRG